VQLLDSRPATQSTAHQTLVAESANGQLNFHPD
jgi:ribosome assembly protein YihI (activator of Der GTPase)